MGCLEDRASEGTHTGVWSTGGMRHHTVGIDGKGAAGESSVTHTAHPEMTLGLVRERFRWSRLIRQKTEKFHIKHRNNKQTHH